MRRSVSFSPFIVFQLIASISASAEKTPPAVSSSPRFRSEWIGVELLGGGTPSWEKAGFTMGLVLRPVTAVWPSGFFVTPFEASGALATFGPGGGGAVFLGARAGIRLRWGARHQSRLDLGLGVAAGYMTAEKVGRDWGAASNIGLFLYPTIQFTYKVAGPFFVGLGLMPIFEVTTSLDPNGEERPVLLFVSVPLGFAWE